VDLRPRDGRIEAVVADDGRGFEPRELLLDVDTAGFGLFRLRQRLEVFGGTLELDSAPGQGARIGVSVPRSCEEGTLGGESTSNASAAIASNAARPEGCTALMDHLRKIRVLLVDDHEIVREGLASLLLAEPDMEVVAEASDGLEALDLAQSIHPDIVLMDVTMPRLDGIEATRRLKARMPDMPIIGLSMHEKDDMGQAMREAGAVAYLSKNGCADALIGLIRQEVVAAG
jgi:CheY-like chemotaxis protein